MGAQHIQTQSHDAPRAIPWRQIITIALIVICAGFFVLGVSPVWLFGDEYFERGPEAAAFRGVLLWAFSVPLGVLIGLLGASIGARVSAWRIVLGLLAGLAVPVATFVFMTDESVPLIFGAGGVIIELALLAVIWFWYRERSALSGNMRLAADLQIGGYMFFAFAAWFICGMGAVPAFGLYPEKMIEFGTQPFAVRLMYTISFSFVLGWVLTAASQFVRSREARG
jgi:hypothetical protein